MKTLLLFIPGLILTIAVSGQTDLSVKLTDRYSMKNGLEVKIKIRIDVPGITVPQKSVQITYEK